MAQSTLKIKLTVAWWLKPYLYGVCSMCWLTGRDLDQGKVEYWTGKAIKVSRG